MTPSTVILLPAAVALATTLAVTGLLLRLRLLLDRPGDRSLHTVPVPRTGGIGIAVGIILGAALLISFGMRSAHAGVALGWLLVLTISFVDDLGHVPAPVRLGVHLAAAVVLLVSLPGITGLWTFCAVLAVAWSINLFNFMDGMDGLAATMALVGAGALAVLGWLGGDPAFAATAAVLAGSAVGFLAWNLPPARIFMGDTGSAGLGFLLAALSCSGVVRGLFEWETAVLVFLPFILDASLTLLLRVIRGARVWEAHREHAYQRLVLAGLLPAKVLLLESGIMLFCAFVAIAAQIAGNQEPVLLLAVIVLSVFYATVHSVTGFTRY